MTGRLSGGDDPQEAVVVRCGVAAAIHHRIGTWKRASAGRQRRRRRTGQGTAEPRGETARNSRRQGRYHQPAGGVKRYVGGPEPAWGGAGADRPRRLPLTPAQAREWGGRQSTVRTTTRAAGPPPGPRADRAAPGGSPRRWGGPNGQGPIISPAALRDCDGSSGNERQVHKANALASQLRIWRSTRCCRGRNASAAPLSFKVVGARHA